MTTKARLTVFSAALVLILWALRNFFVPSMTWVPGKESFPVRVRLAHDREFLRIGVEGDCDIIDPVTGSVLKSRAEIPENTRVSAGGGGIRIGDMLLRSGKVRVSPLPGEGVKLGGVLYRGYMDIHVTHDGLDAINRVELEDYLKGVVPREVNSFWPYSVLKAQAIASRSFAVSQALRRKKKEYDMTADTYSQVYGGRSAERWRTSRAVDETRGKVLEYEGKVLPGYFHSCCGGHTESAGILWGEDLKPLSGVRCPWCRISPYFRWQVRIPNKKILEALKDKGYGIRTVDDIRAGERDKSGRLRYVRVRSRNKWFEISSGEFRAAIGRRVLRSSNFKIKKYPRFYFFSGYGWGHGAGMCQWGAFGLALRWKSPGWILHHYYPGAKVEDLRKVLGET